jgi:hypothetical protein
MSNLRIEGKDLVRPDKGVVFSCKGKIEKMLVSGDFIYLLFDSGYDKPNNVLCIDQSGNIVWEIDAVGWVGNTTFANIYEKDGKFFAGAWSGLECEVDRKTGRVLNKIFMK